MHTKGESLISHESTMNHVVHVILSFNTSSTIRSDRCENIVNEFT